MNRLSSGATHRSESLMSRWPSDNCSARCPDKYGPCITPKGRFGRHVLRERVRRVSRARHVEQPDVSAFAKLLQEAAAAGDVGQPLDGRGVLAPWIRGRPPRCRTRCEWLDRQARGRTGSEPRC